MAITNHERVGKALELLKSGLAPFVEREIKAVLGAKWIETARDLSYRLYTLCDRRKWAQEALAYNTLVLSWGDVKRLAEEMKEAAPVQGELI